MKLCALVVLGLLVFASAADDNANPRQAEVDEMVNNVLQWLQDVYSQRNRKARQYFGGRPEKPRPFEPATYLPPGTGYPPSGTRPTPSYSEGPQPSPTEQPQQPSYQPSQSTYQPPNNQQTFQPTYQSPQPTYQSPQPTYQSPQPTYQSPQPTYQSPEPTNPPSYQPNQSTPPPYKPSQSYESSTSQEQYNPSTQPSFAPTGETPTYNPLPSGTDEDRHPPHIHEMTVDCGKEQMTINIEFNKPYNGLIYSQGFYNSPDCVYVRENSNQVRFSFTVNLEMCGTKFYSDFKNEGQAYLENVLVLQNEVGLQEVWDHIRRVRCLWEGNLNKQLASSLSVGMLNQITSNFSGDTAMARLDIQMGRGPFAPQANGLVKIGEVMTLVISVTGDPGFDIQVRQCVARDTDSKNTVPLTDSNGCVLKPKLFGSFQKTRETGNTGASIIAYAFFNAFKFPDEMDLIIQCDVELCKTDCEMCPNPGSLEPSRKKRDVILIGNSTVVEPSTTIGKSLRVIFPEELESSEELLPSVCMSYSSFLWGGSFVLIVTLAGSLSTGYFWLKSRKLSTKM